MGVFTLPILLRKVQNVLHHLARGRIKRPSPASCFKWLVQQKGQLVLLISKEVFKILPEA